MPSQVQLHEQKAHTDGHVLLHRLDVFEQGLQDLSSLQGLVLLDKKDGLQHPGLGIKG